MTLPLINMTDKYVTYDGVPVTILTTSLKNGNYPVLAVVHHPQHDEIKLLTSHGKDWEFTASPYIKKAPTVIEQTLFVNVYSDGLSCHDHEGTAKTLACDDCLKVAVPYTIKIEI